MSLDFWPYKTAISMKLALTFSFSFIHSTRTVIVFSCVFSKFAWFMLHGSLTMAKLSITSRKGLRNCHAAQMIGGSKCALNFQNCWHAKCLITEMIAAGMDRKSFDYLSDGCP